MKEVIVYKNLKDVRVSWEHKSNIEANSWTALYVNGVQVGADHNRDTTTYLEVSDDLSGIKVGDLIQIWGDHLDGIRIIRNMKIKFVEYINNVS